MLIRSLRAENFMKFRTLELTDIPSRGLVGIVGRNEGGKTTIGELIQFALFGKTLSVARGSILDLIHWDRDHCVVELEFSHDGVYRVWREIDRYGTNYARLLRVDPDDPEKTEEIASGSMPVAHELESRLRFTFDDFLRSFYLAERDFPRSPEKMREFLDRMTGVEVLLSAKEAAGGKVGELEENFGQIQAQVRKHEQQVARYVPNVAKIPELETMLASHDEGIGAQKEEQRRLQKEHADLEARISERDGLADRIEKLGGVPANQLAERVAGVKKKLESLEDITGDKQGRTQLSSGLDQLTHLTDDLAELRALVEKAEGAIAGRLDGDGSDSFRGGERDENRRHQRAISKRRMRIFLSFVLFFIGAGVAGVAINDFYELSPRLSPVALGESVRDVSILLAASAGLTLLLASLLAGSASGWRHRIHDADAALSRLQLDRDSAGDTREALRVFREGLAKEPIATAVDSLDAIRHDAVAEKSKALREKIDSTIRGADPDLFRSLAAIERKIVSRSKNTAKEARKKVQEVSEALKKRQSKRDRVQSEIREYQKQDGRRAELEEKNAQLRREGTELREEMDVHHLAQELLGETVDSIRHRAGPSLGKGIRRLLPYLTDDRYQDLQVTPEFELKLFTGAKSDFLATHELSGGTLEGLSFGFRLSFAQAFVGAVTRAPQFLFLDEPFRAMDRGRVRRTLEALHRLSTELPQVIVVLPDVDAEDRAVFDMVVETEVGDPELVRSFDESRPLVVQDEKRLDAPSVESSEGSDRATRQERGPKPPPRELPPGVTTRGRRTEIEAELEVEEEADPEPRAERPRSAPREESPSRGERAPRREPPRVTERELRAARREDLSSAQGQKASDPRGRGRSRDDRSSGEANADSSSADDRREDRSRRGRRRREETPSPEASPSERKDHAPKREGRAAEGRRGGGRDASSEPRAPRSAKREPSHSEETSRPDHPRSSSTRPDTSRAEGARSEGAATTGAAPKSTSVPAEEPRGDRPPRGRDEFARGEYSRTEDSRGQERQKPNGGRELKAIEEEIRHRESRPLAERAGHRAPVSADPTQRGEGERAPASRAPGAAAPAGAASAAVSGAPQPSRASASRESHSGSSRAAVDSAAADASSSPSSRGKPPVSPPPVGRSGGSASTKSRDETPIFPGGGDWPAPPSSSAPRGGPSKADRGSSGGQAPAGTRAASPAAPQAPQQHAAKDSSPAASPAPRPAPPEKRRSPGKVRDDAAESPSGFLAGIFDPDDAKS